MGDKTPNVASVRFDARATSALLVVASLLLFGGLWSCGDGGKKGPPPTYQFPLEVSATDVSGEPVTKAPVLLDGKVVGYTDRAGHFAGKITERRGAEITLAVKAPDGYTMQAPAQKTSKLELAENATKEGISGVPVSLQANMRSTTKDFFLWVELQCGDTLDAKRCANVPVMIDGEEVTRTNDDGIAHVSITRVPSKKIEVEVDTPTYEGDDEEDKWVMKPEDPNWTVELGTESQVLIFEKAFKDPIREKELEEERERRERRRRIRRRRRRQQQQQQQEEKEDETIQLF